MFEIIENCISWAKIQHSWATLYLFKGMYPWHKTWSWQMKIHSTKKPVTTMLIYPWKCTVLHCNHLENTWKPLVLMTRHFDYCLSASEGDNQSVRSSAPVVSRCFPGGYNVKLYISRGRLAWWLLAFLHSDTEAWEFSRFAGVQPFCHTESKWMSDWTFFARTLIHKMARLEVVLEIDMQQIFITRMGWKAQFY